MLKPVTLLCGHSGCQECLTNLVATENDPHCPICRVAIVPTNPLKVNITLNYLTSSLNVMCTIGVMCTNGVVNMTWPRAIPVIV